MQVQVQARNEIGEGPWSASVAAVPGPNPGWPYARLPQPVTEPPGKSGFKQCENGEACNEPPDDNAPRLDPGGTDKPGSAPASTPAPAKEPPGKNEHKTCVGEQACNDPGGSRLYLRAKDLANLWKQP